MADLKAVEELLNRIDFICDDSVDVCLQATVRFINGDLSDSNVRKAAASTGLTPEQIKSAVLFIARLCVLRAKDPTKDSISTARSTLSPFILEQLVSFTEDQKESCQSIAARLLERAAGQTSYAGATVRVDIEVASRSCHRPEPVASARLDLKIKSPGAEQPESHCLRLSRPMLDRLVGQLEEAMRSTQKKTLRVPTNQ